MENQAGKAFERLGAQDTLRRISNDAPAEPFYVDISWNLPPNNSFLGDSRGFPWAIISEANEAERRPCPQLMCDRFRILGRTFMAIESGEVSRRKGPCQCGSFHVTWPRECEERQT